MCRKQGIFSSWLLEALFCNCSVGVPRLNRNIRLELAPVKGKETTRVTFYLQSGCSHFHPYDMAFYQSKISIEHITTPGCTYCKNQVFAWFCSSLVERTRVQNAIPCIRIIVCSP